MRGTRGVEGTPPLICALKVFVVLMLLQAPRTKAAWQVPYFTDTHTDGVVFQSAVGVQKISVREELAWPFQLAKINFEGAGVPTLGAFDIGDNSLLGARISAESGEWLLTIEKRQDYENPHQRIYSFQIYLKDYADAFMEHGILLTLENIFDNNASITYNPSPCRVEELRANFLTDCIFSVYDPDGMDRNNIRIMASGQNDEAQIFRFAPFGVTTTYERHFKLRIMRELHYEERAIYNLQVRVYDASNNTGDIFAILEVIDVPNRGPIWVRPLTTATFDEKQEQLFTLKAIDGDTGINKPICYRLEFEDDYSQLLDIDTTTGVLHVAPIDRDVLKQQIFSFYMCAYKCDNESWAIKNLTILVVQDINDHIPEITLMPDRIQILEAKYLTLPLEQFVIEDLDLGNNATYQVQLVTRSGYTHADAFTLVPTNGYQKSNFSLTVAQAELLDYENSTWRAFELTITAQEIENKRHTSNRTLTIELVNWNDEWPVFEAESYEVSVMENITKGTFLERVRATDRDVDDEVIHSIVGQVPGWLINATTGVITTSADNVFDYERQTLVLLQIAAKDTLTTAHSDVLHTTYAQLTVNVIDVNDETPELRMPRSVVNITENAAPQTLLGARIQARDADTTADLTFGILWDVSYATKSGQPAASEAFVNCFTLEARSKTNNLVYGYLSVNPDFKYQLDYEKYDTIFLTIRVQDLNQEINEGITTGSKVLNTVLTVRVDDLNDNAPQFSLATMQELRKVTEMEELSTVIGNVAAYDIDGPGNNVITFDIRPYGNLTKHGLVSISDDTGVLRVSGIIECDMPKVYHLEYEIVLSDTVHTTVEKINISILDINNRMPEIDAFEQQVAIYENATSGQIVGQIRAHDDDRDAPHNVLEYTINSGTGETHNLFQINTTSGLIMVHLRNGFSLDRDNGVTYHYIAVDVKDNFDYHSPGYGPVNQRSTFINVTLLDVNDNAPLMPAASLFFPEFSETDLNNTSSKATMVAEDRDEPNTPNSWVAYRILSIKPAQSNAVNVANYADIFAIEGNGKTYGRLVTRKDLKGYYGLWEIEVEAYDHGKPAMRNASTYQVYVRPYNFHAPKIIYPSAKKSIRVCYALQEPDRPLYQADCVRRVPLFQAYDADGAEYGDLVFQLTSDFGHDQFFKIVKENRQQSSFYLQQTVPAGIYYLNVRAIDGGGSASDEIHNLKIVFVDVLGNPLFLERTFETNFTENELGLQEERFIPEGYDPKNEGLDADEERYKLYYFIDEMEFASDAEYFVLDSESGALKLRHTLDREAVDTHRLRIKVTNNKEGIVTNPNSVNYTLDVIVKVNDVNDNPPAFNQKLYAGGITLKDTLGKEILTIHADEVDLEDPTVYRINVSSISTYGENLAKNKDKFFTMDNETGVLSLSAYVTNKMKGYLMFNVIAEDSAVPPHSDVAAVKVYIVSEANRVKFVFLSDVQAIRENEKFIRESFEKLYGYEICNIDAINDVTNQQRTRREVVGVERQSDDSGGGGAFITEVIVHFIRNNEAADAVHIQKRAADLAFVSKLQNSLQLRNLILNDVPHLSQEDGTQLADNWLVTGLIVVSAALAVLTVVIVVVSALKMRALRRQLRAFEPPEFGSTASNLNRIQAPTTNIFSVEGSNPVINNQSRQFQPRGIYEGYSSSNSDEEDDFDGLHEDPIFEMNKVDNYEKTKPSSAFEHKILNNSFLEAKMFNGNDKNDRY